MIFFFSSGPTSDIPSRKKRAIVQQTLEITDNVAACIKVHTIDLNLLCFVGQLSRRNREQAPGYIAI